MKLKIWVFALLVFPLVAFADLEIVVEYNKKWGNAPTSNIKKLCENVALHFQEQLRDEHKVNGTLKIVYRSQGPVAFYRNAFGGGPDAYKIGLTVTGTYWSQFAYQFGHEFCHVMHKHDLFEDNDPNFWFREAICELANLWVLRRMSETWADDAPYRNWIDYRHSLAHYAENLMNRATVQYEGTGAAWIREWEDRLRSDRDFFDYARVSQLSYKFLSIFEETPKAWNAIRQMPVSRSKISEYMRAWHNTVDAEDKRVVKAMAEVMGITVADSVVVASTDMIDADIDNNGYVDLSDVLIVRSALRNTTTYDTDVNNDGVTNELDVLLVKAKAFEAIAAAAPSLVKRKRKMKATTWGTLKK